MGFNKDIPQPSDNLDQSQIDLLNNNQQLNETMSVDHYPFDDTSTSNGVTNNGKHLWSRFPVAQSPAFTAGGTEIALVNKVSNGLNNLHYRSAASATEVPMTRSDFLPTNTTKNGYTFLPGGFIMQWGQVAPPGLSGSVVFTSSNNINFPTAIFNVQLTAEKDFAGFNNYKLSSSPSQTGFSYEADGIASGSTVLFWVAIGN